MEVHHHPHVEKKRFKEYFLEFIMIFLAVTLGFIAENIREHISENSREREFMEQILHDLKADTISYARSIAGDKAALHHRDLYRNELKKAIAGHIDGNALYYYNFSGVEYYHTSFHTSAISELKTSGLLRLVRNKNLLVNLNEYYDRRAPAVLLMTPKDDDLVTEQNKFFSLLRLDSLVTAKGPWGSKDYNYKSMLTTSPPLTLMNTNKQDLEKLYNEEAAFERVITNYDYFLEQAKESAAKLIRDIAKEYHLKTDK